MFETLTEGFNAMPYLASGIGIAFVIVALLFVLGRSRKFTIWHGLMIGLIGAGISLVLQGYLGLINWILLGMMFVDLGASVFFIGMLFMIVVMLWNFVRSSGKTLVR